MKNKFKKIFKLFLSVMLICSMILPTYASLSSGTDNAFVTKAEFDYLLSSFNKRLTNFEASVNSKIDNQVTTYLDRNGIWNRQSLKLNSTNFTYDSTKDAYKRTLSFNSSHGNNANNAYGSNAKYLDPDNFGQLGIAVITTRAYTGNPSVYNRNFKPVKVIDEIPKSGLMHVVIEVYPSDLTKGSGCSCYGSLSNFSSYSYYAPVIKASLCFCEAKNDATTINLTNPGEKGRVQIERMDWYNNSAGSGTATGYTKYFVGTATLDIGTNVLYFFVSKPNSLWQYINGSGGFNYFTAADQWKSRYTNLSWTAGSEDLPITIYETIGVY